MAENALLSSPRWADKQMPAPGLTLRQEAKIRPATAPGDLLLSQRLGKRIPIIELHLHSLAERIPGNVKLERIPLYIHIFTFQQVTKHCC